MSNTSNLSSLSTSLGYTSIDPPSSTNQTQTITEGLLSYTPIVDRQSCTPMQQVTKTPNQKHIASFHQNVDDRRPQGFDQRLRPVRQKDIRFEKQQQTQIEALRQKHQSEMGRVQSRLANDRKHRQRQIEDARLECQRKREQLQAQQVTKATTNMMRVTNDPGTFFVTEKQGNTFLWQNSTKNIKPTQRTPRENYDYFHYNRRRERNDRQPSSEEEFVDGGSPGRLHEEYVAEQLPPEERWQQQEISLLESSEVPEATNSDIEDAEQLRNIEMVDIIDTEKETKRTLQLLTVHERSEEVAFLLQPSKNPIRDTNSFFSLSFFAYETTRS